VPPSSHSAFAGAGDDPDSSCGHSPAIPGLSRARLHFSPSNRGAFSALQPTDADIPSTAPASLLLRLVHLQPQVCGLCKAVIAMKKTSQMSP